MTSAWLLDVLLKAPVAETEAALGVDKSRVGAELVESCMDDWNRIRQYEVDFTPSNWNDRALALENAGLIHALRAQWLAEAEQVLLRVQQLQAAGHPVPKADVLKDAIGLTHARMKLTPEKIAGAMDQLQNRVVPAGELRDELNARRRP